MTTTTPTLYATGHVLRQAHLSYRQLNYWANEGFLRPLLVHGTAGHSRTQFVWPETEVKVAVRMGQLVNDEKSSPAYAAKIARHELDDE